MDLGRDEDLVDEPPTRDCYSPADAIESILADEPSSAAIESRNVRMLHCESPLTDSGSTIPESAAHGHLLEGLLPWPERPQKSSSVLNTSVCFGYTKLSDTEIPLEAVNRYRPAPVVDLKRFSKFPPAMRQREVGKAVAAFTSSGRGLFLHYTRPVLTIRRDAHLQSSITRKKYHKSVEQLWPTLPQEEAFFWHQKALELRNALKMKATALRDAIDQKSISAEQCLLDAGFADEWYEYRRFAEIRAASYLQTELPEEFEQLDIRGAEAYESGDATMIPTHKLPVKEDLLPVLPEPFHMEARMMYGNFAHAEFDTIRRLEGKQQAARLRQLADQLDHSGKELFYYYAFPHIWTVRPLAINQTVASEVHGFWRAMDGKSSAVWQGWSQKVKKLLGDGNVDGLDMLSLDQLNEDVLELRRLTEDAVGMGRALEDR